MTRSHDTARQQFEAMLAAPDQTCFEMTLFVNGASDLSARAIANARHLLDSHLPGRYELRIVDVHEEPVAVISSGVLAAPTLVRTRPLPIRRVVGDLSQVDKVLRMLGLPFAAEGTSSNSQNK
jgi:circadian clock protein KaiB